MGNIVQFFKSEGNLFGEKLALRALRSPTHSAALATKGIYAIGHGFTTEDEAFMRYIEGEGVNGWDETFNEFAKHDMDDSIMSGNSFIEVVRVGSEYFLYSRDYTTFRRGKGKYSEGFFYSPDWTNADEYGNASDPKDIPIYYPEFPKFERIERLDKGNAIKAERSIIHWKNRKPTFEHYGLPDYMSALPDIDIEYRIGKFNIDEFDNNFAAQYILVFYSNVDNEDEAQELKTKIKDEHTGEGNNGKSIYSIVSEGQNAPQAIKLERNTDGSFLELRPSSRSNIITAHQLTPSLMGVETAGKLGSNQQIKNEYEIFHNTVNRPFQKRKIRFYKRILNKCRELGATNIPEVPEDLDIMVRKPISFIGELKAENAMLIDEIRQEMGLPALDDETRAKLFEELKTRSNGNGNSQTGN